MAFTFTGFKTVYGCEFCSHDGVGHINSPDEICIPVWHDDNTDGLYWLSADANFKAIQVACVDDEMSFNKLADKSEFFTTDYNHPRFGYDLADVFPEVVQVVQAIKMMNGLQKD